MEKKVEKKKEVEKKEFVTKDSLKSMIDESVQPLLEKIKTIDVIKNPKALDISSMSKKEKMVEYIRALNNGDTKKMVELGAKAVNSNLSAGAGGYLVPEYWLAEIARAVEDFGIARKLARIIPMVSDTLNLPKAGGTGVTLSWEGETDTIAETNPNFGSTALVAKKLAAISAMSSELIDDANVDVIDYIIELLAEGIAGEEDNQFLNGSGSSPAITGVYESADVTDVPMSSGDTNFADVSADYLTDVKNAVAHQHRKGGSWIMSDSVFGLVEKLKTTDGIPLYKTLNEGDKGILMGYPVALSSKSPETDDDAVSTSFLAFGNFKRGMVIGDRKQVSFDMSKEATVGSNNLFEQDMKAVRSIERLDIAVHVGDYISVLTTAAA